MRRKTGENEGYEDEGEEEEEVINFIERWTFAYLVQLKVNFVA